MNRIQFHDLYEAAARTTPDAPALTYGAETWSYRRFADAVAAAGAGFAALGLGRGERVAVYLEKRLETVAAMFGASAAGGAFVPVNPLLKPRQVAYIARDCGARILVTTPERLDLLREELAACELVRVVVLVGAARADAAAGGAKIVSWPTLLSSGTPTARSPQSGAVDADMAAILYTSGSTGSPKGVVLSHRNLIVGAESVSSYLENRAADRILSVLPLSFDAGLSQLTTAFAVGAHVVLVNYLLPGDVVRLCAKHQITGMTCVPPLWNQLADQKWTPDASKSVRYFANTGGRMPKATLDKLRAAFPQARPFLMYGLTEAFRSTYLDPSEVDRRPDSIGKAIPNAEILVVRPDGTECAPNEEGELVHRGPLVSMGYWNDPERTAERFKPAPGNENGLCLNEIAVWSGDVAKKDEEGFIYFVGRKDEMIKTSGYRVSPAEIEEGAYQTKLVRDAAAFGVDDAALGQSIVLFVTAPDGGAVNVAALLDELRRQLPLYMVPKDVQVRETLPRNQNGKFDRKLLRTEYIATKESAVDEAK
jgi:acyl-CoA ligase (AMP-forming) (exosortase A-associated)